MENKNKCYRVELSTILWAVLAVLLCAVPPSAADLIEEPVDYLFVDTTNTPVDLNAEVYYGVYVNESATLNLLADALVHYMEAYSGSIVNIYGGTADQYGINVFEGAVVTVYGTAFAVDGTPLEPIPDQVTFTGGTGTLTVTYDDDTIADLLFWSSIPINLVNTAGGEPLEAQLWVFPSLINRYGPLSKIWAMVRLPEGITKDDIDSEQTLVLYADGYDVEIEASCQQIIEWCINGTVRTTIIASFDKASLTDVVPDGEVELEVVGGLTDQDFYGIDTVRIVSWSW